MKKLVKLFIVISIILGLSSCKENKIQDDFKPVINIVNDPIMVDDLEYRFRDNYTVEYGESGGNSGYELINENGNYKVVISAAGNNGLISKDEFKVIYEPTRDKSAIVFGDSIVYGICADKYSFANHLNDEYDFKVVINAGYSDYRLSTYDDERKWLIDAVKKHYDDEYDYNYVILEGGVNDVLYQTPLGQISNSKNIEDFDKNTFAGGLESYLYTVTNKWSNSKIGYIITYYTMGYSERGIHYSYETYSEYYDLQKQILDKWNIEYLDLFDDYYSNLLCVDTNKYLYDKLHLNADGHKLITPYIYEWMCKLSKYEN